MSRYYARVASHSFLVLLGGLLVLAFLAEEAYSRFRLPPVLALIGCGVALGPVFHLLPVDAFTEVAPHFGALAFLLILFEGGLDLKVDAVIRRLAPGAKLAAASFASGVLSGTLVMRLGGASWSEAAATGVILAPVSGAIVLPLVARIGFREEVKTLAVLEAAFADVLGVLAMAFVAKIVTGGGLSGLLAAGSLMAAAVGCALAVVLGLVWPRVLRGMGERRYIDALTFGLALLVWGTADLLGGSGALSVLAFGLTLANERDLLGMLRLDPTSVAPVAEEAVARLHGFVSELTFVVRAFFFVFLGVVVRFDQLLGEHLAETVAFLALVTGLRWLLLRLLEREGSLTLEGAERRAVWLMQPRGLVSALLAIEAGHLGIVPPGQAVGMASLVIILTNLLLPVALRGFPLLVTASSNQGNLERPASEP